MSVLADVLRAALAREPLDGITVDLTSPTDADGIEWPSVISERLRNARWSARTDWEQS